MTESPQYGYEGPGIATEQPPSFGGFAPSDARMSGMPGAPASTSKPLPGRVRAASAPILPPRSTSRPPHATSARPIGVPGLPTGAPPREWQAEATPSVGDEVNRMLQLARERREQRRRVVHVLALAQFLVALVAIPGYVSPQPNAPVLAVLGAAMALSVLAYTTSAFLQNQTTASYLLTFGGGLIFTVHLVLQVLAGDAPATAQASLFFLVTILETSLLFSAELTLLLATVCSVLTASALIFALTIGKTPPGSQVYLLVVQPLSIQVLAALIAWLVAQGISDRDAEAQRSQATRYSHAQLEAAHERRMYQEQQLAHGLLELQQTITRVLAGEFEARAEVQPGELWELMQSFNILLERVQTVLTVEQGRGNTTALLHQMLDLITDMAAGGTQAAPALEVPNNSPLTSMMQALLHLQARSAHRAAQLHELLADVAGALQTGSDGLGNAQEELGRATHLTGALVAAADNMLLAMRTAWAVAISAQQLVGSLLPPHVIRAASGGAIQLPTTEMTADQAARLLGHMSELEGLGDVLDGRLTSEFPALPPLSAGEQKPPRQHPIAPLTVPMRTLPPDPVRAGAVAREGDMQERLLELWRWLGEVAERLKQEHQALQNVSRDLGKLSRAIRSADGGTIYGLASVDAARQTIRQLQDVMVANPTPHPVEWSQEREAQAPGMAHSDALGLSRESSRDSGAFLGLSRPSGNFPAELAGSGGAAPSAPLSADALAPLTPLPQSAPGGDVATGSRKMSDEDLPPGGWLNLSDLIDPSSLPIVPETSAPPQHGDGSEPGGRQGRKHQV